MNQYPQKQYPNWRTLGVTYSLGTGEDPESLTLECVHLSMRLSPATQNRVPPNWISAFRAASLATNPEKGAVKTRHRQCLMTKSKATRPALQKISISVGPNSWARWPKIPGSLAQIPGLHFHQWDASLLRGPRVVEGAAWRLGAPRTLPLFSLSGGFNPPIPTKAKWI